MILSANPLVSVIIPSYNTARFILETLESVLAQTWEHKEIIVVDDGSTDETADLLAPYKGRIHSIYQENRGLGGARNTGIRAAQGELFAFLDADDLWLPEFLERQLLALHDRPGVDILYTWWSFIDQQGNDLPEEGRYAGRGNLFTEIVLSNRFPVMAALVPRRCIEASGGFDEDRLISEDWDFWLRLAQLGFTCDVQPLALVKYRFHGTNMTLNVARSHQRYLAVLEKLYATAELPQEILKLKARAYAQVHLTTAVTYWLQKDPACGQEAFLEAVDIWPEILLQEETYYRLICAEQPPGYRATQSYKALDRAGLRVAGLLEAVAGHPSLAMKTAGLLREARSAGWLALAKHYYLAGQEREARRLLGQAFWSAPGMMLNRANAGLWLRAAVGHRRIQRWKQWAGRSAGARR